MQITKWYYEDVTLGLLADNAETGCYNVLDADNAEVTVIFDEKEAPDVLH